MKYRDEEDKCYGIAGMAIGMTIWNGEDLIYKIDIDDECSNWVQFTSDYYFSGNPVMSAKRSWEHTLQHYQMTVGMLIANLMCRAVRSKGYSYIDIKKEIFDMVSEEGKDVCQLDSDEISNLYEETYSYMDRVFRNSSVRSIAGTFAAKLKESRSLSNYEIKELLGMLGEG